MISSPVRRARELLARVVQDLGPPVMPVRWRVGDLGPWQGACVRRDGYYLVELDRTLRGATLDDTIMHELAHVYASRGEQDEYCDDHDAIWGVAYARVYCAAMETH